MSSGDLEEESLLSSVPLSSGAHHRVLIYTTCYNVLDGVVLTIRKIEQAILAAGHHVCIVTTRSGNMANTHMDGEHPNRTVIFLDNSVPIPFVHDPNNPKSSYHLGFGLSNATKAQISEFAPTIVHVTCPDCTMLHLIQYARENEIPLMGTYHSNIPEYMTHYPGLGWLKFILAEFFKHQYNFLQSLYVPTPFIHRYLSSEYHMDKVTNLGVWGRGIDLDLFSPRHRSTQFRQKMGFSDEDVVIMWCGRLVPEKRPDIFRDVVRKLEKRKIPFKALVVGAGPVEQEMKELPNTVFAGWMGSEELSVAYASSDIFLFPSSVETFGNVTLEAAASGLPLVVDSGCSGHLVTPGLNGFACSEGDFDAYYNGVETLLVDPERRIAMSKESTKISLSFEKGEICRRMLDNYATVTNEFYVRYGGHHVNRDREYDNEYSFRGSNIPRPILFRIIELLFVVIFSVVYKLSVVVTSILGLVPCLGKLQQNYPGKNKKKTAAPKKLTSSTSRRSMTDLRDRKVSSNTSSADLKGDDNRLSSIVVVPLKSDDETDSTTSLSEDSWNPGRLGSKQCCSLPRNQLRPFDLAAQVFIKAVFFQLRMEGKARALVSSTYSSCRSWIVPRRKRKMSLDGALVLETKMSADEDSVHSIAGQRINPARTERLNLRRASTLDV